MPSDPRSIAAIESAAGEALGCRSPAGTEQCITIEAGSAPEDVNGLDTDSQNPNGPIASFLEALELTPLTGAETVMVPNKPPRLTRTSLFRTTTHR